MYGIIVFLTLMTQNKTMLTVLFSPGFILSNKTFYFLCIKFVWRVTPCSRQVKGCDMVSLLTLVKTTCLWNIRLLSEFPETQQTQEPRDRQPTYTLFCTPDHNCSTTSFLWRDVHLQHNCTTFHMFVRFITSSNNIKALSLTSSNTSKHYFLHR